MPDGGHVGCDVTRLRTAGFYLHKLRLVPCAVIFGACRMAPSKDAYEVPDIFANVRRSGRTPMPSRDQTTHRIDLQFKGFFSIQPCKIRQADTGQRPQQQGELP